jgi:hypothetical protein
MKDLHNVFLVGMNIRNSQNKINAARKVAAAATAAAAATTTAAAIATSNVTNTSISTSASTLINGNEITVSFESVPPPSSDPSTISSLPSYNDETRASRDINSLSDQSSILASQSINEITTNFEANASFELSSSLSNASDSSMVGAQSSKRPRLASQQSDAVVDLSNKSSIWIHMNNYYRAMSLLWMFPVTETVSFMHAYPNSRIVQLLQLNKQAL